MRLTAHLRPLPLQRQAGDSKCRPGTGPPSATGRLRGCRELASQRQAADLLEALVALDRAGVDHRDIKPTNLGVREGRSDR